MAAVGLLLLSGGRLAAAGDDGEGASGGSAFTLPDAEPDPELPRPLAFKPLAGKPLTVADLPPSSVLHGGVPRAASIASVALSGDWRAGSEPYRAIVEREAQSLGLPAALIDAVMAVESGYNPAVVGGAGEIGLMQLMPATARLLGFSGTEAQLAVPEINIHYGAMYLAGAWRLAAADLCTTTMKYRAGHGETQFSFRSVDYCVRVRAHLAARGVAVSGAVPRPTFGAAGGAPSTAPRMHNRPAPGGGAVNFAALNARLRALTDRAALNNLR